MSNELVPFDKHKGQPVEVMLADPGYKEWLLAQPWFRDRFPTFYTTIINYGGEPQDTPEHNQLQASFLDDDRCLALAKRLLPKTAFDGTEAERMLAYARLSSFGNSRTHAEAYRQFKAHLSPTAEAPRVFGRRFEDGGWDLVFRVVPTGLWLELVGLPACLCTCGHERDCPGNAVCRGGDDEHSCEHRHEPPSGPSFDWWQATSADVQAAVRASSIHAYYRHCNRDCPWHVEGAGTWLLDDNERNYEPPARTIRAELKPDLGDDFPSVLRQVVRHDAERGDSRCVVARRHSFEQVSWEQVAKMFAASGIVLIDEAQLVQAEAPPP
jgi:hypothetical protein